MSRKAKSKTGKNEMALKVRSTHILTREHVSDTPTTCSYAVGLAHPPPDSEFCGHFSTLPAGQMPLCPEDMSDWTTKLGSCWQSTFSVARSCPVNGPRACHSLGWGIGKRCVHTSGRPFVALAGSAPKSNIKKPQASVCLLTDVHYNYGLAHTELLRLKMRPALLQQELESLVAVQGLHHCTSHPLVWVHCASRFCKFALVPLWCMGATSRAQSSELLADSILQPEKQHSLGPATTSSPGPGLWRPSECPGPSWADGNTAVGLFVGPFEAATAV